MFQVGEMIVYGGEGVCRVEAVGPIAMDGVDRDRLYYTLAPLYRSGRIYTPVDAGVFMRPVLTREEAEALVREIPEIRTASCPERSVRLRSDHYQRLMRSHRCVDLIELIKTAYEQGQARRSHGSRPGQVEERFLKRAEDLLHGELAVALGIGKDQVPAYIARVVEGDGARAPSPTPPA